MMSKQLACFVLFTLSQYSHAQFKELNGRVDKVVSGDTIVILDAQKKHHKVYLLGIDAPELKQPYGKEARDYLDRLLFARNNQVKVIVKKYTKTKSVIGTVYAAKLNSKQYADINGMMVMAGFAWANPHSSKQYIAVEQLAHKKRAGLWKQKYPIAPWRWRKKHP